MMSLLGAKRTSLFAAHMSAYDPKRTSEDLDGPFQIVEKDWYDAALDFGRRDEAARIRRLAWRRGRMAARCACSAKRACAQRWRATACGCGRPCLSGAPRSVRAGAGAVGLDYRRQLAHRYA